MPPPPPAFREGVNILLARTEEIQKVHAFVSTSFPKAEQNQVFAHAFFGACSSNNLSDF